MLTNLPYVSCFALLSAMLSTSKLFSFSSRDDFTRSAWLPTMMMCDDPWAELQAFSMRTDPVVYGLTDLVHTLAQVYGTNKKLASSLGYHHVVLLM